MADDTTGAPAANGQPQARPAAPIRWLDAIITGLNALGTAWIFVIMVLINADVFSRFLFNAPIAGIPLIIELSILVIVFMQLASALRSNKLTRSDVLIAPLLKNKPVWGLTLQGVYHFVGFVLMVLLVQHMLPFLQKTWQRGTYEGVEHELTIPSWPLKLLVVVGGVFCAIQFLRHTIGDIRSLRTELRERGGQPGGVYGGLFATLVVGIVFYIVGGVLELSSIEVGLISLFFVLFLVYIGVHVGVALGMLSFICIWIVREDPEMAGKMLALAAAESLNRYEFGVIPLFVLMGLLVSISEIGKDTYDVANHLFRKVRAGLGMATVGANAVFAAVTGTSIASASVFTRVAVPEMLRLGYRPRFAVGVVAGSSVLGMLIPPSLLLILYGIITEVSIGDLFIAGIVPGIVLSVFYCFLIWFLGRFRPDRVATAEALNADRPSEMTAGEAFSKSAPIVTLIIVVLGGIYGGVFTATEAGAVGALGALILTAVKRKLNRSTLWQALSETGNVTAAICFLLIAAHLYARMIAATGIPNAMEAQIDALGLSFWALLAIYIAIVIILGTILDAGSIMLITVPLLVLPLTNMGVDLVWFGIVTIIAVEIGLLTPPLGLACFVIHNNLQDDRIRIDDIFIGAAPFAVMMFVVLMLVVFFPWIATGIVNL